MVFFEGRNRQIELFNLSSAKYKLNQVNSDK